MTFNSDSCQMNNCHQYSENRVLTDKMFEILGADLWVLHDHEVNKLIYPSFV